MGLGSKKRDYKTEHKHKINILKKHYLRMKELIKEGKSREEASKIAYNELTKGIK